MGEKIKKLRKLKNLSRKELAEKVNITVAALSNYENGHRTPRTEILYKIASELDVEMECLISDYNKTYIYEEINNSTKIITDLENLIEDMITELQDIEYMTTSMIGTLEDLLLEKNKIKNKIEILIESREKQKQQAKERYKKYMDIPGNREKRLKYYKDYYRKNKGE